MIDLRPRCTMFIIVSVIICVAVILGLSIFLSAINGNTNGSESSEPSITGYIVKIGENQKIAGTGTSMEPGETIGLALTTDSDIPVTRQFFISDIQGKRVATIPDLVLVKKQINTPEKPWEHGYNFDIAATYMIPTNWPSGVYFINNDPTLFFILRPNPEKFIQSKKRTIGILLSTNTFNAYSVSEGYSLYVHPNMATTISFLRPQNKVKPSEWIPFLVAAYNSDLFSNRDVIFLSDLDMDNYEYLKKINLLFIVGHSEYWSGLARQNFDRFIDTGGDSIVASGNTMWWQIEYTGKNNTQLLAYKGSFRKVDPFRGTKRASNAWNQIATAQTAIGSLGSDFLRGGYGVFRRKKAQGWGGFLVCNSAHPFLKGTGLKFGDVIPFFKLKEYDGPPILGFDADGCPIADASKIPAKYFEILGFDLGYRSGHTLGAMTVMKKTEKSGIIFHFGAKDFSLTFEGKQKKWTKSADHMLMIFSNALNTILDGDLKVNPLDQSEKISTQFVTPSRIPLPKDFIWIKTRPPYDQNPKFNP